MILSLIAISFLGLSPAAADGGATCANCHTQPKKKDAFTLPPFFGDGSNTLSPQDEAALRAYLAGQNGQAQTAPQSPFPARVNSTPCIYNCHASNPSPKPDFRLLAMSQTGTFAKMDPAAVRAWLGYPDASGNPATAALTDAPSKTSQPAATKPVAHPSVSRSVVRRVPKRSTKAVAAPNPGALHTPASPADKQPDPPASAQPAQTDAPAGAPASNVTGDTAAKPQLEATAADGKGREHFDGANGDAPALVGDLSVDASGDAAAKASPLGQVYLKPQGPSSQITDPPKPPTSGKVNTDPSAPRDWSNNIAGGITGVGAGILVGLMFGGLPGAAIGALVGAVAGGLLGFLL